jgi:hypothetical protein
VGVAAVFRFGRCETSLESDLRGDPPAQGMFTQSDGDGAEIYMTDGLR